MSSTEDWGHEDCTVCDEARAKAQREIERKDRVINDVISAIGTSELVYGQPLVRLLRGALS